MKKTDFQQLKNKSTEELKKDLKDSRNKLHDLKLSLAAGKVKNVSEIRKLRKLVAMIMTLVNTQIKSE